MMHEEFEALIGHEITVEEFRSINYIYTYSCDFQEKQQIADFYLSGGMAAVKEYEEYMDRTQAIWTESPSGDFPGVESMKKMVAKALAPDTTPADEVDAYDWDFRCFLRRLSCLLLHYGPETMHKVSLIAKELYANPTLKALTQSLADKKCDQADNYAWTMQGHIGNGDPLTDVTDYSRLYLDVLETMGYNI